MKALVTGSSGHLGEALSRTLSESQTPVIGIDIKSSPWTDLVGSITDPEVVEQAMQGVEVVYHTATLHKPHVATHGQQEFIDTNISGTLCLLEAARRHGVRRFVFTSTTSVFGDALKPADGAPAVWVSEDLQPVAKNIYGVTKLAAEGLCRLFFRNHGLPCIVLRTSRFFPEEDDDRVKRQAFHPDNLKVNELLFRRADIEDVVTAHLAAAERAPELGFGRYIVSATPPFHRGRALDLRQNAQAVIETHVPGFREVYEARGWKMLERIERVYDNQAARRALAWRPTYDFAHVIGRLRRGEDFRSPLAQIVGAKGYHAEVFEEGPYPVD